MLAWPVFIEQILVSLVSYVDTAMVGSMGANATAAVSISNSPNMLVNGTIMAIGVGFTAMISRSIGAEDLQRAKDLMRQGTFGGCGPGVASNVSFVAAGGKNSPLDGGPGGDSAGCCCL